MKKFSIEFSHLLYESLEEKVEDKLTDKFSSLKRGVLGLLEESVDRYEELVNVQNFINKYIEKPDDNIIEGFIEEGDIFNFYLKYQADIDSLCQEKEFFNKKPNENNIFSLYAYVIAGTKFSVIEIMKILETEVFGEVKK